MDSLAVALALIKANWNDQRDYLSNFEPFVADCLKDWPAGSPVKPEALRERLGSSFSIPRIPVHTAEALIDRAKRDKLVMKGPGRSYVPNPQRLAGFTELAELKADVLRHISELSEALIDYARRSHGVAWSRPEAEYALDRFATRFSAEMAIAKRDGLRGSDAFKDEQALLIVHGFARNALERDSQSLERLEEMVRGSLLANMLYFRELGDWEPTFDRLVVYLDATPTLRILEMAPAEMVAAAKEMFEMLKHFKIPVRVFEHTVVEVVGVLDGAKSSLLRGDISSQQSVPINREVVDAALANGTSAADIEQLIAEIDARLLAIGIQPEETPRYPDRPDFSEARLEEALQAQVNYRNPGARVKDLQSLTAIHFLRQNSQCRTLGKTPALFVTTNRGVARAAESFFRGEGLANPIPHALTDVSLTTQLWVRRPGESPDLPRKVLIAESFAALNPAPELWEKYLIEIRALSDSGAITDEQVKTLVYSIEARDRLIEVTKGDPEAVNEATPQVVLEQFEASIRTPLEEQAKAADAEKAEALNQVGKLQTALDRAEEKAEAQAGAIRDLADWKANQEEAQIQRNVRRRRSVVILGTLVALAGASYFVVSGQVESTLGILALAALVICLGSTLALAFWPSSPGAHFTTNTTRVASVVGGLLLISFAVAWASGGDTASSFYVFGIVATAVQLAIAIWSPRRVARPGD